MILKLVVIIGMITLFIVGGLIMIFNKNESSDSNSLITTHLDQELLPSSIKKVYNEKDKEVILSGSDNNENLINISLINNTDQALINGETIFKITFNKPQKDFIGNSKFKDKSGFKDNNIKDQKWYVYNNSEYVYYIDDYNQVCGEKIIYDNGTVADNCSLIKNATYESIKNYNKWDDYDNKIFYDGTQLFKFTAKKHKDKEIDFIPNMFGIDLNEFAWWSSSWSNKKQINITGGNSELSDFKVFLKIDKEAEMQSDYDDLRFLNGAEDTELNCELDYSNTTIALIWCNIPTLSTGTNPIYMYYGNAGASGTWTASTWGSERSNVYHFSNLNDSAGNDDLITKNNSIIHSTELGFSHYQINGQYLEKNLSGKSKILTIVSWFNFTHPVAAQNFLMRYKPGGGGYDVGDWNLDDNDAANQFTARVEGAGFWALNNIYFSPPVAGRREMIALVLDGTGAQMYYNGQNIANDSSVGITVEGYRSLGLADYGGLFASASNISIDEWWYLNNTILNADYILRTYQIQNTSTIIYSDSLGIPVTDTCAYSTGNWDVTCSDNCSILSNVSIDSGCNITLLGSGTFNITDGIVISNWDKVHSEESCYIKASGQGGFRQ